MSTSPSLFCLPPEIRQSIYSYLIPDDTVSHPIPNVGVTSVTHVPPTADLLCIHPSLTAELQDYFFHNATWKLVFSHAFNFFRIDPTLSNFADWHYLNRVQRVEVVFFCDILLLKEYPSFGLQSFCAEIMRRASRACEILASAQSLRHITVSWIDTTRTGAWEEKAKVLQPLRMLRGNVEFSVGTIIGPEGIDEPAFVKAVESQIGVRGEIRIDPGRNDGPRQIDVIDTLPDTPYVPCSYFDCSQRFVSSAAT